MLHSIEVRRINRFTYDLFIGTQWDDAVRVKQGRSSTYVVLGQPLPKPLLRDLHEILHPTMPITYGQTLGEMLDAFHAMQTR
jgi:hypothetical protein